MIVQQRLSVDSREAFTAALSKLEDAAKIALLEAALSQALNNVDPTSGKALPDILLGLAAHLNRQADAPLDD